VSRKRFQGVGPKCRARANPSGSAARKPSGRGMGENDRLGVGVRLSEKAAQGKGSRQALGSGMNNTRYHRFRIERDAPTQEQYGSIVVGIPIGVGDFDKGSISTAEESTVRRCLSIPDGVPFTMLQHPIDPDRRDYEGKAAAFSRPDGTLVWVKKPDESFAY
jgi:hypothetical protein